MFKAFTTALILLPTLLIAQSWQQVASVPIGKHHPVTFAIEGKGYAITGSNSSNTPTDDVFQYDPTTNQWTQLSDFPGTDRGFAIGQAYNGKGYIGFGLSSFNYLNDIWEYDPATNSWSELTTCSCTGRRHPAFIIRDDKIYVGLGDDFLGDLDDWHIYDMNTDTWTQADDIPGPGRHHPFMFPAGDHIYAGMGHSGPTIYDDWYMFNTDTDEWVEMEDFPGESRVAGTQFGHQGKGYVLSGDGSNHDFMETGEFWEYNPQTDSWTELTPHPGVSRWAPGSFVIDGAVYFLAGENRVTEEVMNDMWVYQLSSPSSTNEVANQSQLQLYPNPATDILNIKYNLASDNTLRIFNTNGQMVHQEVLAANNSAIDVSSLSSGIYTITLETESAVSTQRLIVQ